MKQQIIGAVTLALCLLAVYLGHENTHNLSAFDKWKDEFGMNFDKIENEYRRIIFEANVAKIEAHNADKTHTHTQGINQFTALTQAQFQALYLGAVPPAELEMVPLEANEAIPNVGEIDWSSKITPVKNQARCGSCWAFSAIGTVESEEIIGSSHLKLDLDEQELVDCSGQFGNHGCNGGWPSSALKYIEKYQIGITAEYPYHAKDETCKRSSAKTRYKIKGTTQVNTCTDLINSLQNHPISVTVDASSWSSYRGGVMTTCGKQINHAVLLVGYSQENNFFKIKNSWGTTWGENGFIRLNASPNNHGTCGICTYPSVHAVL